MSHRGADWVEQPFASYIEYSPLLTVPPPEVDLVDYTALPPADKQVDQPSQPYHLGESVWRWVLERLGR